MLGQGNGDANLEEDIDRTIAYIDSFQIGSPGGKDWEDSDAGFHDQDEGSNYPDIEDDEKIMTTANDNVRRPDIEERTQSAASWAASLSGGGGSQTSAVSTKQGEYKAWQKEDVGDDWNAEGSFHASVEQTNSDQAGDFCHPSRNGPPNPWTTPLTNPPKTLKFQEAEISHVEYPFLTAFLCKKRSIDFPFPIQKELITFILYTIQYACYEFVRQKFPDQLKYSRIQCFDQIDLFEWTAFIEVRPPNSTSRPVNSASDVSRAYDVNSQTKSRASLHQASGQLPKSGASAVSASAMSGTQPTTVCPTIRTPSSTPSPYWRSSATDLSCGTSNAC